MTGVGDTLTAYVLLRQTQLEVLTVLSVLIMNVGRLSLSILQGIEKNSLGR